MSITSNFSILLGARTNSDIFYLMLQ